LSLSQTGGGGGGPPPPHREASTTSINDAPLQSLLQRRNIALANPQPVGKAGFDGVGSRTRPFVRGPRLPSRVGSGQRQLCRPPYHIQHPVSTRPSRLVGGVCSFERGLPLSGVPARGPSGLGPASGMRARGVAPVPLPDRPRMRMPYRLSLSRSRRRGGGSPKENFPISLPCSQPAR
jgi:hypothetical protein